MYRDLTTRRVLVEERFDGISVDERDQWRTLGLDGTELADRLVQAMMDQLLHGHFHADPHPGNVLVLRDGSLGLIDFGLTGHIDPAQRMVLFQLMTSAAAGDGAGLRDAIEQVATVGSEVSDIALDQALARFAVTNLRPGQPLGPAALNDLVAPAEPLRHPPAGQPDHLPAHARAARGHGPSDRARLPADGRGPPGAGRRRRASRSPPGRRATSSSRPSSASFPGSNASPATSSASPPSPLAATCASRSACSARRGRSGSSPRS